MLLGPVAIACNFSQPPCDPYGLQTYFAFTGEDDDIVIQAFKEQTKQYKQVYEAAKV